MVGFYVRGFIIRIGFWVSGLGFRVWGFGGLGFRVAGLGFRA